MNVISILITIIVAACNIAQARRLGGKGNLRGMITTYSGLTPIQRRILRRKIMREQMKIYGRFA